MKHLTVKRKVTFEGMAPFDNVPCTMIISPAEEGISFWVDEKYEVPVNPQHTKSADGDHTTLVANDKGDVRTVEHILSALHGVGITACRIDLYGSNQPPITDSSTEAYTTFLKDVGVVETSKKLEVFKPKKDMFFEDHGSYAAIRPSEKLTVSALIQFEEPIGEQYYKCTDYMNVAFARSYIRRSCNKKLWKVCRKYLPMLPKNREDSPVMVFEDLNWIVGPKVEDEPVRHKILDIYGDLYLLGKPIIADVTIVRPHHDFNRKLVNYLFRNAEL